MGQILKNAASISETPDSAESFWDVLDKAQNAILLRYPDRDSIARKMALKELESIAAGSQPEPEKILEIRSKFPFVQSTGAPGSADASNAQSQAATGLEPKAAEPGEDDYNKGLDADEARNFTDAFNSFMKAANQGNAKAQCKLGLCYAAGKGVEKDQVESVKWYHSAAELGDAEAEFNLQQAGFSGNQGMRRCFQP